jgi:hypothetical protein
MPAQRRLKRSPPGGVSWVPDIASLIRAACYLLGIAHCGAHGSGDLPARPGVRPHVRMTSRTRACVCIPGLVCCAGVSRMTLAEQARGWRAERRDQFSLCPRSFANAGRLSARHERLFRCRAAHRGSPLVSVRLRRRPLRVKRAVLRDGASREAPLASSSHCLADSRRSPGTARAPTLRGPRRGRRCRHEARAFARAPATEFWSDRRPRRVGVASAPMAPGSALFDGRRSAPRLHPSPVSASGVAASCENSSLRSSHFRDASRSAPRWTRRRGIWHIFLSQSSGFSSEDE